MTNKIVPFRRPSPPDQPPQLSEHHDTVDMLEMVAREASDLGWTREEYLAQAARAWALA